MLLSYWLRLICLAFFGVGLLQVAFSILLHIQISIFGRVLKRFNARWQERTSFAAAVASHFGAFTLTATVVAPQYIRNEPNLPGEHVGILCVCGACLVVVRYAYALVRAACLLRGVLRRQPGTATFVAGVPVRLVESERLLLAVEGLIVPRIIASPNLLDPAIIGSEARRLALAHETAHARHFDNLKLFLLLSLSLPFCSDRTVYRWRRAAEIAADSDAVGSSKPHAILLAQTLLALARTSAEQPQPALSLTLLPHEEDLETRIHHLIEEPMCTTRCRRVTLSGMCLLFLSAANLFLPLAFVFSPEFAESVLHLG
jgi:hypothetical protein